MIERIAARSRPFFAPMTNQEPTYRASTFKIEDSPATWQAALARLPNAHALQSWAWGQFKARWGWEALPLTMSVGGNSWETIAAAMVLKRRVPRLPYCVLYVPKGPVLDYHDKEVRRQVLARLEQLAKRERAIFIKIDPEVVRSWGLEDERVSPLGTAVTRDLRERGWRPSEEQIQFRNTVELPLEATEEQLLAAMKQKTRYNIRLAERKGVAVRPGSMDDFPTIVEMYQETAARDGFTVRPAEYYLDGWSALYKAGMAQPLVAEVEGRPVAAVILVRFGERVIYMYGASRSEARDRMPNHLLQWEAIRWAREQGAKVYDFWGAPDEFEETDRMWGVWRFKAGFNGEVVRFIGALLYRLYTQAIPRYLEMLRARRGQPDEQTLPG
jgi:lipid II:glycine glycyltransferase (peptidoglycan interpeptide bridge formation enzyme)